MEEERLAADRKKAAEARAHLVLIDETGLFLNPLVRRSWAKVGRTPVLAADGGHRDKVSAIGAVTVSPTGRRLTGAALDRITHRCQIIETTGESYRLQDAKRRRRSAPNPGT